MSISRSDMYSFFDNKVFVMVAEMDDGTHRVAYAVDVDKADGDEPDDMMARLSNEIEEQEA